MQVFKTFMKITLKKLPAAMIYIGVFLTISIIMANMGGEDTNFSDTKLDICVMDEDNSDASRALKSFIEDKHDTIEVRNDEESILDAIYYNTVDYVLVIKEGYSEKISQGGTEGLFLNYTKPGSFSDTFFNTTLERYTGTVSALIAGGNDISEATAQADKILSDETEVTINTFAKKNDASYSEQFSYYFQYMPYVLLAIFISLLVPVMLVINGKEVRNRTNCSKLTTMSFSMQIFLGTAVVVLAVWAVFIFVGFILNGFEISGRIGYAVLNSFVFTLVSAGIALVVSSLSPSEKAINMIGNVVSLGMSFLCGIFVPLSILGDSVINISRFLPAYWYVRANNMLAGISEEPFAVGEYFKFLGVEMLFAVILFVLVILIFRIKKKSR
ncbi:MAG: ABC transporter permease [Oscillospiraceae bacterium]|nr:ABC transporter permease [Oscillospiraceae bacterium]